MQDSHLSKIRDEFVVVVGKAQKQLKSLDIPGLFPISSSSNLVFAHMYLP